MIDLEHERQLLARRVLGRGFALVPTEEVGLGRDLRLTTGPNGVDLASIEGLDNLGQVLAIALTTRLGDDLFNAEFGFDGLNALSEETNPILVRERIRIGIIQVLRKEPRVSRIVDVKLEDERLDRPLTRDPRELPVRVVYETLSGERASAELGRLILDGQ